MKSNDVQGLIYEHSLTQGVELDAFISTGDEQSVRNSLQHFRKLRLDLIERADANVTLIDIPTLGLFDVGLYQLAVPVMHAFQAELKVLQHQGVNRLFDDDFKLRKGIVDQMQSLGFHERLSVIHEALIRLGQETANSIVSKLSNNQYLTLGLIAREYAEYRNCITALIAKASICGFGGDLPSSKSHDFLILDMCKGFNSSLRSSLLLLEVIPSVAREHGVTPTARLASNTLITGRVLPVLAKTKGVLTDSFGRIASGCTKDCFDNEIEAKELSPHRLLMPAYGDFEAFKSHWEYAWFDSSRFSVYASAKEELQVGPNFTLANELDPLYGKLVSEIEAGHPWRIGCPALRYGGVQSIGRLISDVCLNEHVWDVIVQAVEHEIPQGDKPILPLAQLTKNMLI